jgi:hypothetical protein
MKSDIWEFTEPDTDPTTEIERAYRKIEQLQAENAFLHQEIKSLERYIRSCYNDDI